VHQAVAKDGQVGRSSNAKMSEEPENDTKNANCACSAASQVLDHDHIDLRNCLIEEAHFVVKQGHVNDGWFKYQAPEGKI